MAMKKIIKFPALSLRQPCREVSFPLSDDLLEHIQDLKDTLAATSNGVALASNQILAEGRRVFVVKPGTRLQEVVINPAWKPVPIDEDGFIRTRLVDEGCLSVPEAELRTQRFSLIEVKFQDIDGERQELRVLELDSQIVQHECDHLDGKLLLDYADPKAQIRVRNEAIRNRKAGR